MPTRCCFTNRTCGARRGLINGGEKLGCAQVGGEKNMSCVQESAGRGQSWRHSAGGSGGLGATGLYAVVGLVWARGCGWWPGHTPMCEAVLAVASSRSDQGGCKLRWPRGVRGCRGVCAGYVGGVAGGHRVDSPQWALVPAGDLNYTRRAPVAGRTWHRGEGGEVAHGNRQHWHRHTHPPGTQRHRGALAPGPPALDPPTAPLWHLRLQQYINHQSQRAQHPRKYPGEAPQRSVDHRWRDREHDTKRGGVIRGGPNGGGGVQGWVC